MWYSVVKTPRLGVVDGDVEGEGVGIVVREGLGYGKYLRWWVTSVI